ncbi:MAG: LpxD N-terminal domain-containing protein, partial [Pseudohongiellaceae bacterium]
MTHEKTYTLGALAELLNARLVGDPDCIITGLASLREAGPGSLSFLSNPAYFGQLAGTRASAVIVEEKFVKTCPTHSLVADQPYVTFARATQLFAAALRPGAGIHPAAIIDDRARISTNVSIGPHAVIAAGAEIGAGSIIGAGCVIGEDCRLGNDCCLHANVTLYHKVWLGDRVE